MADLATTGERLAAIAAKEARLAADLAAGMTLPGWVDPVLAEKGCQTVDFTPLR
jgi:hypothetical protein